MQQLHAGQWDTWPWQWDTVGYKGTSTHWHSWRETGTGSASGHVHPPKHRHSCFSLCQSLPLASAQHVSNPAPAMRQERATLAPSSSMAGVRVQGNRATSEQAGLACMRGPSGAARVRQSLCSPGHTKRCGGSSDVNLLPSTAVPVYRAHLGVQAEQRWAPAQQREQPRFKAAFAPRGRRQPSE